MRTGVIHLFAEVLLHSVETLLNDLRGRGDKGVAFDAELLKPLEAADGVRENGDFVVTDVKLDEGDEETDGVGEVVEELEILTDVEDLEVDEVFEVFRKSSETVQASVEDTEGSQVRDGVRKKHKLVGVD